MPYDTRGGGHRGEPHLYCPRTEVKFSEMKSGVLKNLTSVLGQYMDTMTSPFFLRAEDEGSAATRVLCPALYVRPCAYYMSLCVPC